MEIAGLVNVKPCQEDTLRQLGDMMGECFLDEYWTRAWLDALDRLGAGYQRKLEISQAVLHADFTTGAGYAAVHMLPDMSAAAGCYLASELQGAVWDELEYKAFRDIAEYVLSGDEGRVLAEQSARMRPVTNMSWVVEEAQGQDFMHFYAVGVTASQRGSGAFRRLFSPFMNYADSNGLTCYLECYSEKTEAVYSHYGFSTVHCLRDPGIDLYARLMARQPA